MEIENHKEEVPFEYYLEKYQSFDIGQASKQVADKILEVITHQ